MKNLITTAAVIVMGGAFMASQSAFGQVTDNSLYLGFQNEANGGTKDYIINLGPASGITNGSSVLDLSSDFSLADFNGVLGSASSMYGGVVGGSNLGNPSDIFVTQLRAGGAGVPANAGSDLTGTSFSYFADNNVFKDLGTLVSPPAGTGTNDTTKSWENDVESQPLPPASSTFWGDSGINPDSAVSKTNVLYEDLWVTSSSSTAKPFVYLGYFTLDLTGATPQLTFTPKSAPAPLTKAVIFSVTKTGNTVTVISSNAVPSHTYQLQYLTSLSSTNWTDVGALQTAVATTVTNTDTTATDAQRFYQIKAQ